jgi:hypothetical protein
VKIILRNFSGKIGREFSLKPTIQNESSHETLTIMELRVANFAIFQISTREVYIIRRGCSQKCTWTSMSKQIFRLATST